MASYLFNNWSSESKLLLPDTIGSTCGIFFGGETPVVSTPGALVEGSDLKFAIVGMGALRFGTVLETFQVGMTIVGSGVTLKSRDFFDVGTDGLEVRMVGIGVMCCGAALVIFTVGMDIMSAGNVLTS